MRRSVAVVWHTVSFIVAACLYFFFVLPRWPELAGSRISHTAGTVLRIVTGVAMALTALPVLFTLRHTRRPEFGTPQLALNLRVASIIGAVLAGVMVIGTAVAEIWISLDDAGPWLFGSYGAAAAVEVLAAIAFYLAYVAELPPAQPKPIKTKKTARADAEEPPAPAETEESDDAGKPGTDRRGLRNRRPANQSG